MTTSNPLRPISPPASPPHPAPRIEVKATEAASSSTLEAHDGPPSSLKPTDQTTQGDESYSLKIEKPSKRTNVKDLRESLTLLGLDSTGKKETLYKRLLKHFHRIANPPNEQDVEKEALAAERSFQERLKDSQDTWRSFLCFDVEATCRGGKEFDWPNEIIEFPVVLCQWTEEPASPDEGGGDKAEEPNGSNSPFSESQKPPSRRRLHIVDTFHTYVRPTWQPILSEFCTTLTGITQGMVDASPTFPEILGSLESWLDKHDLRDEDGRLKNAVWVTDGPWDLRDFIPKQLHITRTDPLHPPYFFGQFLNIKNAVQTVLSAEWSIRESKSSESTKKKITPISTGETMAKQFKTGSWKGPNFSFPISGQVAALGLGDFEGRQHSGLDDAMNISRILIALSERTHVLIHPNARTPSPAHMRKYAWMGRKPGIVNFENWMSTAKGTMLNGKAYGVFPNTVEKKKGVEGEGVQHWRLMEDAAGHMRAVKIDDAGNGAEERGKDNSIDKEEKEGTVSEELEEHAEEVESGVVKENEVVVDEIGVTA